MTRHYMICKAHDCNFSKSSTQRQGLEKHCPTCGDVLLWRCPKCDEPLRNKGAAFCSMCGEGLKEVA